MTGLRGPLLSLDARGRLTRALTLARRLSGPRWLLRGRPADPKTPAQQSWRTMWQLAASLWHHLSAAEQAVWEREGTARHMTGFAWYMSQALRPNPGIYLPLAGGVMAGDVDMNGNAIEKLPTPADPQDAARKAYVDAQAAGASGGQGARITRLLSENVPDSTYHPVTYSVAEWDNDGCFIFPAYPSRLYCQTAGIYAITTALTFPTNAAGRRQIFVTVNDVDTIAVAEWDTPQLGPASLETDTIYQLAVGDYLTTIVYQTSGGNLTILTLPKYSPAFTFARIR